MGIQEGSRRALRTRARRAAPASRLNGGDPALAAVAESHIAPESVSRAGRVPAPLKLAAWITVKALPAAEALGLLVAFMVLPFLRDGMPGWSAQTAMFVATIPGWFVLARLYGLHDHDKRHVDHSTGDDIPAVFQLVTTGTLVLLAADAWFSLRFSAGELLLFWPLAVATVTSARACARGVIRRTTAPENTIIVGAGHVGRLIEAKLSRHPEYGIRVVGFVDRQAEQAGQADLLGDTGRLAELCRVFDVERVIVAFSRESDSELVELVRSLESLDVRVDVVPRLFDLTGLAARLHRVEGLPLVSIAPAGLTERSRAVKRVMDIAFSATALVVLAPLLALIGIAIRLESAGPVFFRQRRVGRNDSPFRMLKFRTMVADADERKHEVAHLNKFARNGGDPRMFKIAGDPRVTRVGALLRRYSLDELPQLVNVLRGEMSLVGPRPLIPSEDRHVSAWARRRLDLRPGMTGLWQVLGRNEIPFEEMVKIDYLYVRSWSVWTDLKLMLRTVPMLFRSGNGY